MNDGWTMVGMTGPKWPRRYLAGHELVRLQGGVDVAPVDAQGNAKDHVLEGGKKTNVGYFLKWVESRVAKVTWEN